jgi:hypothetical protein
MNPEIRLKKVKDGEFVNYSADVMLVNVKDERVVLQVRYPVEPLNPLNDDMTEWQNVPFE